MKFVKTLLLSLLTFFLFSCLSIFLFTSIVQKKFPPSLEDAGKTFDNYSRLLSKLSEVSTRIDWEQIMETNNLITSRKKLEEDLSKLDIGMADLNEKEFAKIKMKKESELNRDWNLYKTRLEQSEYKIKILELEMATLKNEIKQLTLKK